MVGLTQKTRALVLLGVVLSVGCSVYPDQEIHSAAITEESTTGDEFRVLQTFTLDANDQEFPAEVSKFAARVANMGKPISLSQIDALASICKPPVDLQVYKAMQFVQWESDGAISVYLMKSAEVYDGEVSWDVQQDCDVSKVVEKRSLPSLKNK